ncbi:MAG: hypothetical protein ACYDD7_15585, partial [Acidimicrobiales bacterium]
SAAITRNYPNAAARRGAVPRSEFRPPRRRPAEFLDRADEFRIVHEHVALLSADRSHLKVFEIVGLGGVGKTRFLNEVRQRIDATRERTHLVWVSLESEASSSATGPLRVIRSQLGMDCLLFDCALLSYWAATGQPFQSIRDRKMGASIAMRALETGGGLAGIPLPLTFAADLFAGLDRMIIRRRRYQHPEFEAIDELRRQPAELFARLPHYLGLDIHRRVGHSRRRFVFFYDAYEKQTAKTLTDHAPWLREFIATIDTGVHLISTRDPLGWDDAEWGEVLQAMVLGALPEAECRNMIRDELGQLSSEVEDRLLVASHQIPFFLQAAIDICHSRIDENGTVLVSDLPSSPAASVGYLLDHLDHTEQTLAVVLGCLQYFDEALYAHVIRALNLPVSVVDIDEFVEWFFVSPVDHGLFKTHDLLSEALRESVVAESVKLRALQAATDHLAARSKVSGTEQVERLLQLFHAVIAAWTSTPSMPTSSAELLIDIGYEFYDAGFWKGLEGLPHSSLGTAGRAADLIARYFAVLAARRTQGPREALQKLEALEGGRDLMGRHASSFDLEVAYLSEITGNYARAREEFRVLNDRVAAFDSTRRDHVRSRLYHADMLVMDGEFVDASRLLVETYEAIGPRSPLAWAELVRHRGHAYRFSFVWNVAEQLYLQALDLVRDWPSMSGKLYTNLAETHCWIAPALALEDASVATRINVELGNPLEAAKCDAARAVALAQLSDPTAAREACDRSRDQFLSLGYPAGAAFALQARVVVDVLSQAWSDAEAAYQELREWVASLGTYGHLRVIPAWLLADETEFMRSASEVEWISPTQLEERLERLGRPSR